MRVLAAQNGFQRCADSTIQIDRRKLDGKQEALLVALACSAPPTGHHCWTMQMLADRMVELKAAEAPLSDETVRRTLKKRA